MTKFLTELENLAQSQAKLNQSRLIPARLDPVTSFIGNHPWQVILVLSLATALLNFLYHFITAL